MILHRALVDFSRVPRLKVMIVSPAILVSLSAGTFYKAVGHLLANPEKLQQIQAEHDAIGALELVDEALKNL